jgi:exonuclease SbcD
MMVKLLHTSDVQLDAPFHFLGSRGSSHRQQLRDTFQHIVDVAAEGRYDALLITGDLFNDNRPHQSTLDFVAAQLGRLDVPVCILPGNHDCYDGSSAYRKARFPENAILFTEQPTITEIPELDMAVYGNAITSIQSRVSPLRGLERRGAMRWHVAMAHGNLVRPDIFDPPRPIQPSEISDSGMHYVAMGDWHAFADYSQGGVKAYYAGAPEPTGLDQKGAGYVACIEMDENGVRVHSERVATISTEEMTVDVTGRPASQVKAQIAALSDKHLMLKVTLSGLMELGTPLDTEQLVHELAPSFWHFECFDESHPQLEKISTDDYPEELVVGKFVRLMQARLAAAPGRDDRRRLEQALQLGVALLQGRRVL